MNISSSNSSVEGNNISSTTPTKKVKQISPSKNWCFTFNNYKSDDINNIKTLCSNSSKYWVFQEETGESGTPHLQGYIEFNKKVRPSSIFKDYNIWWQKRKGSKIQATSYCLKEDSRTGKCYASFKIPKPIKVISKLRKWQEKLKNILLSDPDDRTIYWYWDKEGGKGKSAFCKYMCYKHDAICISGKGADMKYGIIKYHEKHGVYPEIIILDIPRTNLDYLSYTGIEEVKNGCFFNTKYECEQVIMNSPHIVCFANEEPELEKMSLDRWKIKKLN